jgi:ribosome-associated heat shock protein Hsp15
LPGSNDVPARQRLDKWLWCARLAKARDAAAGLAAAGHVRINGQKTLKPGHGVKPGDVLTVVLARQVAVVRVTRLADRRGPAPAARLLYETPGEPPAPAQKSGASPGGTCY